MKRVTSACGGRDGQLPSFDLIATIIENRTTFLPERVSMEARVPCQQCADLCVRYAIRHPRELHKAIKIAAQNIADGVLVETIPDPRCVSVPFEELLRGEKWEDYVEYHFRCLHCSEEFSLRAETYHGSGGYWEPKNSKSIREDISN